ncbi:MAG: fumarylacetoacetate hydrolase family protein [Caulobacteraceae bacterium]|nr:fumarylacetoacetate hydrolase family protein [Caulobacter sp.]
MRRARIFHEGRDQWVEAADDGESLRLGDGRVLPAAQAHWAPPARPGCGVYALGLNYRDHSAELGFAAPAEPLIFMKGSSSFTGHRGVTPRPADADQMHPECELVAVIGRPARRVRAAAALDYVGAYTVACDYAIRGYLENYLRPNLRVKNRDANTPLGPWLVDAEEVGDPARLALSTTVNGEAVQAGSTADMVHPLPELIARLSHALTLSPGDMILTGTPHGVRFVEDGDEVACEVERVGRLVNHIRRAPAP